MAVKRSPPPGPLIGALRGWWQCHQTWRRICGQLKKAGVEEFDPVYPLVREIGMVPARISRLVIVGFVVQLVMVALLMEVVHWSSGGADIEVTNGQNGRLVISFAAPRGGRWVACNRPDKVCFEVW